MDRHEVSTGSGMIEWAKEADLIAAQLRAAEADLAATAPGTLERALARQRLEVLAGELDIAMRRWGELRFLDDGAPDPRLDRRLRRLAHARLESEQQVRRARTVLKTIRDPGSRW